MGEETYFPTCLLRKTDSFAVHGLMMLSEGEMYCLDLRSRVSCASAMEENGEKRQITHSPCSILD